VEQAQQDGRLPQEDDGEHGGGEAERRLQSLEGLATQGGRLRFSQNDRGAVHWSLVWVVGGRLRRDAGVFLAARGTASGSGASSSASWPVRCPRSIAWSLGR